MRCFWIWISAVIYWEGVEKNSKHMSYSRTKIIILVLILIGVVSAGILIALWQKDAVQTNEQKSNLSKSDVVFPSLLPTVNITNAPAYDTSSLPLTTIPMVPVYQTIPINLEQESNRVARTLGVNSEMKFEQTSRGEFYTWKTNDINLTVGGPAFELSYGMLTSEATDYIKQTQTFYEAMARDFINKLNIIPNTASLVTNSVNYVSSITESMGELNTTPSKAKHIIINFNLVLNNLPLMLEPPNQVAYTIKINSKNQVESFFGHLYPQIGRVNQNIQIISLSNAKTMLLNGNGVLLSSEIKPQADDDLTNDKLNLPLIQINSVNLSYYFIKDQNLLIPVYLFKGLAESKNVTGLTNTVETLTLVSALP